MEVRWAKRSTVAVTPCVKNTRTVEDNTLLSCVSSSVPIRIVPICIVPILHFDRVVKNALRAWRIATRLRGHACGRPYLTLLFFAVSGVTLVLILPPGLIIIGRRLLARSLSLRMTKVQFRLVISAALFLAVFMAAAAFAQTRCVPGSANVGLIPGGDVTNWLDLRLRNGSLPDRWGAHSLLRRDR